MKFTIRSKMWGELTWEEGKWSGDVGLVAEVEDVLRRGRDVPTVHMGPWVAAASEPAWVAWYTAVYALREVVFDGDWSEMPPIPPEVTEVPPEAIA